MWEMTCFLDPMGLQAVAAVAQGCPWVWNGLLFETGCDSSSIDCQQPSGANGGGILNAYSKAKALYDVSVYGVGLIACP